MASYVIDASVTGAWFFKDESTPFTDKILNRLIDNEAMVPTLWIYECANLVSMAQRRGRITRAQKDMLVDQAELLPLSIDRAPVAITKLARLAGDHNLSAYDAAYLELALRTGAILVTLDRQLLAAARAIKHPVETDPD